MGQGGQPRGGGRRGPDRSGGRPPRSGERGPDPTEAFAGDGPPPSGGAKGRAPVGVGSRSELDVDEESTRFFARSGGAAVASRPPQPPAPGAEDLDTAVIDDYDDYDDFGDRYDTANAYDSPADREPTPALLAAKAEPLAGSPSAARRAGRKPAKSGRTKAGEAARASKARSKRKPKEPSKLWLAAGIAAILLAGFGTAYFLTQRGGDDSVADGDAVETLTDGESTATSAEGSGDAAVDTTVAVETTVATGGPPVVIFDDAAVGPIESAVPYTLAIGQGPADAMYQLLVDNEPQAEPALELPPVTFAPGRHLLVVNITSPQGDISTDPVLVYALAPTPEATWRANLSSVDVANEGWAEAVRQYEDYVATGHAGLQLMPSDRFPELTSGYWNLFVGGFPDNASAAAYCEEYGLSVPDQCFPTYADPNAAAGG